MCCIAKEGTHTYHHDEVLGYNLPYLNQREAMDAAQRWNMPPHETRDLRWTDDHINNLTSSAAPSEGGYVFRVWEIYPLIEG